MIVHHSWKPALLLAGVLGGQTAWAQTGPTGGVEIASDEIRRGLSWSGGRVAPSADAAATLGSFDVSARVVALRGSARHAGADAVIDVVVAQRWTLSAVSVGVQGVGHAFVGARGHASYGEMGADVSYVLGPLQLRGGGSFAPSQAAIGGSNLYLFADASAGIPGTPYTLSAGLGRSSGTYTSERAARLRPEDRYLEWRVGVERTSGRLTVALDYAGTDIGRLAPVSPFAERRPGRDRLVLRGRLAF